MNVSLLEVRANSANLGGLGVIFWCSRLLVHSLLFSLRRVDSAAGVGEWEYLDWSFVDDFVGNDIGSTNGHFLNSQVLLR